LKCIGGFKKVNKPVIIKINKREDDGTPTEIISTVNYRLAQF